MVSLLAVKRSQNLKYNVFPSTNVVVSVKPNYPYMLNRTLIFSTLLIFAAGLTSCSIYPENPILALGSKESRIANTWKVSYATDADGDDVTSDADGTKYTLGEEGDAELDSQFAGANFTAEGTWTLTDEDAAIKMNLSYTVLGIAIPIEVSYDILKLTKDELWLQDQNDSDIVVYLEPF